MRELEGGKSPITSSSERGPRISDKPETNLVFRDVDRSHAEETPLKKKVFDSVALEIPKKRNIELKQETREKLKELLINTDLPARQIASVLGIPFQQLQSYQITLRKEAVEKILSDAEAVKGPLTKERKRELLEAKHTPKLEKLAKLAKESERLGQEGAFGRDRAKIEQAKAMQKQMKRIHRDPEFSGLQHALVELGSPSAQQVHESLMQGWRRSSYTTISSEVEVALGETITAIRNEAKEQVANNIEKDPASVRLSDKEKKKLIEKGWRKEARKDSAFKEARDKLVAGYASYIYRFVEDPKAEEASQDAEDLFNTAIARALETAEIFDPHENYFPLYLPVFVSDEIGQLKKVKEKEEEINKKGIRVSAEEIPDHSAPFTDSIDFTEMREWASDIFSQLPEKEKTIIRAHYVEEKELKDIGKMLGVTGESIRQERNKALDQLKERILLEKPASILSKLPDLTEREREIMQAHYFEGKTLSEIAQSFGVTKKLIMQQKSKAVDRLLKGEET